MIIENRALRLARSFASSRYNHRVVIITLIITLTAEPVKQCNCRKKDQCPLERQCLTNKILNQATVTTGLRGLSLRLRQQGFETNLLHGLIVEKYANIYNISISMYISICE